MKSIHSIQIAKQCAETEEYLKAHPGITLPVPNDVKGDFSWRQSF